MAGDVIDSLVVLLNLDPKGFTDGQKEAVKSLKKTEGEATKTAKNMQAEGKKAGEFFSGIKTQVLALGAAFLGTAAITSFANHITASDAALGRLATNVGMSTEDLSAWEGAAVRAGGSAAAMDATLKGMTAQMQEFRSKGTLSPEMQFSLAQSGIDPNKYLAATTTNVERLAMAAKAFKGMDAPRAQMLGKGLGFDEGTINLLLKGDDAVAALVARQKELNAVSKADTDAAIARENAYGDLTDTFQGLGRTILTDVSPAIVSLLGEFQKWAQENRAWIETGIVDGIKDFGTYIRSVDWAAVGQGISDFVHGANSAAKAVGGWKTIAEGLFLIWTGGKLAAMLSGVSALASGMLVAFGPVQLMVAGIAASIAAISYARDHEDEWRAKFDNKAIGAFQKSGLMPAPKGLTPAQQAYVANGGVAHSAVAALIASGEGDYNSVNRGKAGGYKSGTEDLENMTLDQVMMAQKVGKFNAAGRYQMIKGTLSEAVTALGLNGKDKFSKETQDKIFSEYLVTIKRKALGDYISGKSNDIDAAVKSAAQEWASVADPATGKSYYAGVGNNKASISLQQMTSALQQSRAQNMASNTNSSEVNIQNLHLTTTSNDPYDHAASVVDGLKQYNMASQANYGTS